MKEKIYVHVADDHKIVIEGIIAVINTDKEIELRGCSSTGQEVIDWFKNEQNNVDVLILDITMPIIDGFEVLKYFKKHNIDQKVIVFSSYDDLNIVQEVVNLGCKGYVSKNNAAEHIINAIKTVAKGELYYSEDIQKKILKSFSGQTVPTGSMPDAHLLASLTERELEVLKLIAKEYNTMEMADFMNISKNTLETHRKNLMRKLNINNAVGIAMYAVKNNIV